MFYFCIIIAGFNTRISTVPLGNPENNFSSLTQWFFICKTKT